MTPTAGTVTDFAAAAIVLDTAGSPHDLFGPTPTDGNLTEATRRYRGLARLIHPDVAPDRPVAQRLFVRLGELWAQYTALVGTGSPVTVTTRRGTLSAGRLLARGDLAHVYAADYQPHATTGDAQSTVWKVARHPRHNDLLNAEAQALRRLTTWGDLRFAAYVPTLLDAFTHEQAGSGMRRRTTVQRRLDGYVSLAQLIDAFPGGIDARDTAWMWRRLLVGLGHAHRAGVVHGAVVPEHVLIHPEEHGLVLIDWCHAINTATTPGARVTALVTTWRSLYPPEVLNRQAATPATDIFMASQVMALLMNDRMPRPMRAFIAGCTSANPLGRPQDAWALQHELDELLARLYGPRRFRPFHLPADMPRTGRRAPTTPPTRATGDPGTPRKQED